MKKLALLFALLPWAAFAQSPLGVTTFTLPNGLTVWVNEDHSQPKVFGAVVVKAGAKDCPNTGIAHYLEHLLFKGTQRIGTVDYAAEKPWLDSISWQYDLLAKTHDAGARMAIQRHINSLSLRAADYAIPNEFSNLISLFGGTGLNAYTSFDETVFHNYFAPQYLGQWLQLNAERFRDPVFRLFQGELETVYEEKNMYADNLLTSTAEHLQQYALAGTPYAYPILGATDSLKNPRLSEMLRFFRQYYVPANMAIVLSGDIQHPIRVGSSPLPEGEGDRGRGFSLPSGEGRGGVSPLVMDGGVLRLRLPIPFVKAGGFAWVAPNEHSSDYAAFKVMTSMLTNADKTGLMDSLTTAGRLLYNMGIGYDFKDFSAWGFGFVPRLPFGTRRKAERLCFQQIDKLRRGQFSDADLEAEKLTLRRNHELSLETIAGRGKAMINAFSHGLSWDDVVAQGRQIAAVTRDDIMRVARTCINSDSLKIVKVFGHYPKEHVSQPGYKPVAPKNAGRRSAYAEAMAKQPVPEAEPRLIDLRRDACRVQLAPLAALYTTPNPIDSIFTLRLVYRRGTANDRRLAAVADYLNSIGTARHSRHRFGQLLRRQGATLEAEASATDVTLTLTGFDSRFAESVGLLREFLAEPQADKRQFHSLVQKAKLRRRAFFKDNRNIASAVLQCVARGNDSEFLMRLTPSELKRVGAAQLVTLFRELQHWQTDMVYCGSLDAKKVESIVKSCLPADGVSHVWQPASRQLKAVAEPTVYVYDNPSARQTVVGTYQTVGAMPTADARTQLLLWGSYFGGGMESVTFQEIREFRALAYYAHGHALVPDLRQQPDAPCGYVTLCGTQADKASQTVVLVDSLLRHMPLRESGVASARRSIVNGINNGFPTFRAIGSRVADLRLRGYVCDPDSDLLTSLPHLGIGDVDAFYRRHVQSAPHAIIVVGDLRSLDHQRLAKLGKVVRLTRHDIYH